MDKVEYIAIGTRFKLWGTEYSVLRTGSETCLVVSAYGKRSEMKCTLIFDRAELIAQP